MQKVRSAPLKAQFAKGTAPAGLAQQGSPRPGLGSPEVLSAALFVTAPSPRNSLPSDAQGEEGEAVFFPFFLFLKKVNK